MRPKRENVLTDFLGGAKNVITMGCPQGPRPERFDLYLKLFAVDFSQVLQLQSTPATVLALRTYSRNCRRDENRTIPIRQPAFSASSVPVEFQCQFRNCSRGENRTIRQAPFNTRADNSFIFKSVNKM